MKPTRLVLPLLLAAAACQSASDRPATASSEPVPAEAIAAVDTGTIMRHTRVLSADSLMGRQPGTPGEDKAVALVTKAMGRI